MSHYPRRELIAMTKRIRIASGIYKGRYVGQKVGGMRTDPELIENPEVGIVRAGAARV
jgi:hypothetical protein